MFFALPESDLDRFLEEDVPCGDLTTRLLGIGERPGRIVFTARETTTLCCTEEAGKVLQRCGAVLSLCLPSGSRVAAGTEFLAAEGPAQALHAGWKVALNLLEHASGIATRTQRLVALAKAVQPAIAVVGTRKSFPGTKKVAIKALLAGGAMPHRLGLSETILVFRQHTAFCGGLTSFLDSMAALKAMAPETKVIVEAESAAEALLVARSGADIVQLDKLPPTALAQVVPQISAARPDILISAAGGINETNIAEYAATGVDIIVLSAVYSGRPADIGARIHPISH